MKYILLYLTLSVTPIFADWGPLNLKQLLKYSDLVVLVKQNGKYEETKEPSGKTQLVEFQLSKIIKGKNLKEEQKIIVFGSQLPMCKAQYYFPNKKQDYLLFLRKQNNMFHIINGEFGALPILNNKVKWFIPKDKQLINRENKELTLVLKEIKEQLTKQ
jgi:hypothetical protein